MKPLQREIVTQYIEQNIGTFHQKRVESLSELKLSDVLKRKNPYMFRAKALNTAADLVKGITDAHIASSEETIFGDWLEELAIFICGKVFGGWKSAAEGIDLEFDKDSTRFIVNIKSGSNWGNGGAIKKLKSYFTAAMKTLRTSSKSKMHIIAVNGCCYGRDNKPDKGEYYKYCGQVFWEFISGDDNLYRDIIEPLGHQAKEKNDEFNELYEKRLNLFVKEFIDDFCTEDGGIDWDKLVQFNSSKEKPKRPRKRQTKNGKN
jgi:hypothetical protein